MSTLSPTLQRFRLTYARGQALRYISHLDMQRVWERTFRRARLPLAYSQGFHPHPRLHMAAALPLGFLSRCELLDAWLDNAPSPRLTADTVLALTRAAAPPGLEIAQVEEVDLNLPALQTQVSAAEYLAVPLDPLEPEPLRQSVTALLAAGELPRERRSKPYNLRPLVEALEVRQETNGPALFMRLSAREAATGRPEEVLDALGLDPASFRVERIRLVS